MELGERVKQLRIQYGLTQEELADRCELSKGFISMLENDLTSPSVSTLQDLLEVFGLTISEFFSKIEDKEEDCVVYTKDDYFVSENTAYTTEFLITDAQSKELEALKVKIKPGGKSNEVLAHEGAMFGYVLEGNVKVVLGDSEYAVGEGETFYYYKPVSKQYIVNNSKKKYASILWLSTPPVF